MIRTLRSLAATILAFLCCATLHAEQASEPIPDALKSLVRSKRNHEEVPAVRVFTKDGLRAISLSTSEPLTDAQWDAVAALHPRVFVFNDQALTDKDMDRLAMLDPVEVTLRITPLTGAGAAKFGEMLHLRRLETHHMHEPTPEAKEALANHPTLEIFRTAGEFGIDALRAPKLKSVELAEQAANIASVEELGAHSKIETLSLFAHRILSVDKTCLASVAKIKTLKTLRLSFVPLNFADGLRHLLDLPNLTELSLYIVDVPDADLQKFKAARPQVKVNLTPMSADYRKTLDEILAKAKQASVLSTPMLRVEVSDIDGALTVTDLRNKRVWQQVRVEADDALKQRIIGFDAERNELTLECGLAGTRADGKRAVASARITLRIPRAKSNVEMTVHLDAKDQWRQAAYPYVFARDGERVSNLFPHCEGLLVPVRKSDPDWLALPDGDLYGGVHSYLMCLGLVDEASGEGLLTLLPDIEATQLKWRDVSVNEHSVIAPQFVCRANKGSFDRPWRMTFSFSDQGGYVAMAQRYREFFAAQGLHKTLREKAAENPAVNEILGAPIFWANTRTPKLAADMADSFRAAGVDRCLFAMCNVPLHKPDAPDWEQQMGDAIKRVRALGYHVYRYDQYRDAFEPDPAKGHSHQINTNAWPDKLVHKPDSTRVAAFGPQSGIVCAKFFMSLAMETFDREFAQFDYSARFLDCLGSVGFGMEAECHDPAHPCDRYFTRQQRTALLAEVNRRGKLAATECGMDYLIPHVHWFEGASTLVRWKEFFPAKQTTENIGINEATGGKLTDRMAALGKLEPTAKADLTLSISPRHRIPFYSLCHHDEVIVTWRWEDGMDDPPVYWQMKNLWSVLSGTPPMYRTTADRIAKYREQITRTQHYVSDWVREVALDAMTNHRFLTDDHSVQEAEFSSGRGVVVNFGDSDLKLPDGQVVRARDYLTFRKMETGRAYHPPSCPNVFAR
jgi:hypothetical protein